MAKASARLLAAAGIALLLAGTVSCGGPDGTSGTAAAAMPTEAWKADGRLTDGEYTGQVTRGNYEIRWRQDGDIIEIGLRAGTTGWVAIGFQPGQTMRNADIVIGYVKDGAVTVSDQFSTGGTGPHGPDTTLGGRDDLIEYGGSEDDGFTVLEFSRRLATGDEYDNDLVPGSNQVIWSYGETDDDTIMHAARGYAEITL
jgi:hypothetical protein